MNTILLEVAHRTRVKTGSTNLLAAVERIKLEYKYLKIIAYKLPDEETAVTLRQMALAVRHHPRTAKKFIKKVGVRPIKVQMPNHCIADMVDLPTTAAFWKSLNESGQGNLLTRLGQEMLADYLDKSAV